MRTRVGMPDYLTAAAEAIREAHGTDRLGHGMMKDIRQTLVRAGYCPS